MVSAARKETTEDNEQEDECPERVEEEPEIMSSRWVSDQRDQL